MRVILTNTDDLNFEAGSILCYLFNLSLKSLNHSEDTKCFHLDIVNKVPTPKTHKSVRSYS